MFINIIDIYLQTSKMSLTWLRARFANTLIFRHTVSYIRPELMIRRIYTYIYRKISILKF